MSQLPRVPKKITALLIIIITYVLAILGGYLALVAFNLGHPLLKLLVADVIATLIVFLGSSLIRNASVYDPYWSVAPLAFLPFWFFQVGQNPILLAQNGIVRPLIASIIVLLWGIRLTANWLREFTGFDYEDWRYRNFRAKSPKIFWLINLTGIQLFPTLLVFLGSMALYPALTVMQTGLNLFDWIGVAIALGAVIIELFADNQMWQYRRTRKPDQPIIESGLWIRSRHPNYFGEISFWWGLYFFALATSLQYWWMAVGPIAITLLFLFISIPMIENRHRSRKPAYEDYMKRVPMLFPRLKVKKQP